MIIHEDDSVPRGQARVSLDFSEVWCHPDDAAAIRHNQQSIDEAQEQIAQELEDGAAHECSYCAARRSRGWACSACPHRKTNGLVAQMPDERTMLDDPGSLL